MSLLEDINIFTKIPFSDLCITTGNFWRVVIRYVTEREIPYLKENGLASTGKPSAAERIQQGIPSTDININENTIIINNFIFESLLEYNALEKLAIETCKKFEKFNKSFEG